MVYGRSSLGRPTRARNICVQWRSPAILRARHEPLVMKKVRSISFESTDTARIHYRREKYQAPHGEHEKDEVATCFVVHIPFRHRRRAASSAAAHSPRARFASPQVSHGAGAACACWRHCSTSASSGARVASASTFVVLNPRSNAAHNDPSTCASFSAHRRVFT